MKCFLNMNQVYRAKLSNFCCRIICNIIVKGLVVVNSLWCYGYTLYYTCCLWCWGSLYCCIVTIKSMVWMLSWKVKTIFWKQIIKCLSFLNMDLYKLFVCWKSRWKRWFFFVILLLFKLKQTSNIQTVNTISYNLVITFL